MTQTENRKARAFKVFLQIIRQSIADGDIKISKELTDYDLAVQFAITQIGKRRGYKIPMTAEEIFWEIEEFAPELNAEG